jgi:hypothetical protein
MHPGVEGGIVGGDWHLLRSVQNSNFFAEITDSHDCVPYATGGMRKRIETFVG